MTLENCKKRLALAEAKEDAEAVKFWTERIAHKLTKKKYKEPVEVKKSAKKSKR